MLCYVIFAFHKNRPEFVHHTTVFQWIGHFRDSIIVFVPRVFRLPTLAPFGKAWGDARHWELGCWIWVLFSLNRSKKEKINIIKTLAATHTTQVYKSIVFRTFDRSLPVVKLDVKFPTLSTMLCSDSLPFNKKYTSARIRGISHLKTIGCWGQHVL